MADIVPRTKPNTTCCVCGESVKCVAGDRGRPINRYNLDAGALHRARAFDELVVDAHPGDADTDVTLRWREMYRYVGITFRIAIDEAGPLTFTRNKARPTRCCRATG